MLERLADRSEWERFYEQKLAGGHLSFREAEDLRNFIDTAGYLPVAWRIQNGDFFGMPEKRTINKIHSGKKRVVYTYDREENYVLKMLTWLLYAYDGVFSDNLYSFRCNRGVKKALYSILAHKNIDEMYVYKADIHDYFNSVDISLLLPILKNILTDDGSLYQFLAALLENELAVENGEVVRVKKGIMAGTPISAFLANVYLMEMDRYFQDRQVLYVRYSDDIILFAQSHQELMEYKEKLEGFLKKYKLQINEKKVSWTLPGEAWQFLGISYCRKHVDLADVTVAKMKSKMRRKARALLRWRKRRDVPAEPVVRKYIQYFNRKFYDNPANHELTWCRWFFPLINTDQGLHILDRYMQACIRYLASGKHTKASYNLRYETLRKWGYRPLVSAYYRERSGLEGDNGHL